MLRFRATLVAAFWACCHGFGAFSHHPFVSWFSHISADVMVFAFWGILLEPIMNALHNVKPHLG